MKSSTTRFVALLKLIINFVCVTKSNSWLQNSNSRRLGNFIVSTTHFSRGGVGCGPPNNNFISLYALKNDNESISPTNPDSGTSETTSTPSDESNGILSWWRRSTDETKDDIKSTVISFSIAIFVRLLVLEPRYIPSLSMFPTFDIGDQLLVDKVAKFTRGFQRRDVVVFNPADTYVEMTGNTEALIKRIVAVAGDTVEVKDNNVYVNGVKQVEPYTAEKPDYTLPATTVPVGYVLVLGDNRNKSFDSHVWGLLPEKNIIGRAVLKYWPPWRVGFVEGSV